MNARQLRLYICVPIHVNGWDFFVLGGSVEGGGGAFRHGEERGMAKCFMHAQGPSVSIVLTHSGGEGRGRGGIHKEVHRFICTCMSSGFHICATMQLEQSLSFSTPVWWQDEPQGCHGEVEAELWCEERAT